MENERVKKSKDVLEEKRKMVKQKISIKKTTMFSIINMNFVQEQLNKYISFFSSHGFKTMKYPSLCSKKKSKNYSRFQKFEKNCKKIADKFLNL